jgi:DNA-binding CsgD family transcriptional regulator
MNERVDWEALVALLLERETRPAAVIGAKHTVIEANAAFRRLLEPRGAPLAHRPLLEVLAGAGQGHDIAVELERAFRHPTYSAELRLEPHPSRKLVANVVFQRLDVKDHPALLVVIESWASDEEAASTACGADLVYDVRAEQVLTLEHVWHSAAPQKNARGPHPCYLALHGRQEVCAGCPAWQAIREQRKGAAVVRFETTPQKLNFVFARPLDSNTVRMYVYGLERRAISEIFKARVNEIAAAAELSQREREVLDLLLLGRSTQQMAIALAISVSTAKFHQANLLSKLGADSRFDVLRLLA